MLQYFTQKKTILRLYSLIDHIPFLKQWTFSWIFCNLMTTTSKDIPHAETIRLFMDHNDEII